jgi:thiol-disulfide isomerase/thioredoxin
MKTYVISLISTLIAAPTLATTYPPFEAKTLSANTVASAGKITYLKFWATWCSYCMEEMPALEQSFQQANNGYQVIAINIGFNQTPQKVSAYLQQHQYQFPTVFDSDGSLTQHYKVLGTPQHILIDETGRELYRSALFTDELKAKLTQLQGANHAQ